MRDTQKSIFVVTGFLGILTSCSNTAAPGTTAGSTAPSPAGGTTSAPMGAGTTATGGTTSKPPGTAGTTATPAGGTTSIATGGTTGATGGTTAPATGGTGAPGATCKGTGAPLMNMCRKDADGIFALKTELDVWYFDEVNDGVLFDPGRGKLNIYFRGELSGTCDDGTGGMSKMQLCGITVPAIYADGSAGVAQITFPDKLFDEEKIAPFMTTHTLTGNDPSVMLTIAKAAGLVGISLPSVDSPWPTPATTGTFMCTEGMGAKCFPDTDGDGKPGVSVEMLVDPMKTPPSPGYPQTGGMPWKYAPAPLSIGGALDTTMGAKKVYVGLRSRLGGGGLFGADCKTGSGPVEVDGVENRVTGCGRVDGTDCTPAEARFVNEITPAFNPLKKGETPPLDKWIFKRATLPDPTLNAKRDVSPSKGSLSYVVRLGNIGEKFTCGDVRNAAYPAAAP